MSSLSHHIQSQLHVLIVVALGLQKVRVLALAGWSCEGVY